MKTLDQQESKKNKRVKWDEECGYEFEPKPNSWSSYLATSSIQFRTPDYSKDVCKAPELEQAAFPDQSARSTIESPCSIHNPVSSATSASPRSARSNGRRVSQIIDSMFDDGNVTPGILRPEEQQNSLGRCRHKDNRYFNILDTEFGGGIDRRPRYPDDQDLQSAATLVASPHDALFDKYEDKIASHRNSTSSCSSYSSQATEDQNPVSTNRLIRYYTGGSDLDDDNLTRRVSRFSTEVNPWLGDENVHEHIHPLKAHSPQKQRKASSPPPCLQPQSKVSHSAAEYYDLKAHGRHNARRQHLREKNVYLLKLCKAFILFGIQAHRLDEYLHITAMYLDISAEFQYVPHCLIVVLNHPYHDKSEVHLLKESTSVDLGKLEDVYEVYRSVIDYGKELQLGIRQLDSIMRRRRTYTNLLLILLHGLAAMCAGSFAFSARPVDFAPLYFFGSLLAILQLLVLQTPIRNSHVLEVLTCIIVAFCARGLGSIMFTNGSPLFCFSGIVQGTIALILPGHIILAATHEIQNRQVLSGSVKMIYAILYTLFLGFGILIGTALFGFIDPNATNETTCDLPWYWQPNPERWRAIYAQFIWVPLFALAISIMHQAKPKHLPAMVFIATCGHQAFYWSLHRFAQNLQFAGMIAAFASGILANIYARFANCLAATVLLPAVLVHIPNALAASGSLVAGVDTADAIVTNRTYYIQDEWNMPNRYNVTRLMARDYSAEGPSGSTGLIITSGFGMAQATIGIVVGLFLSAFVVYPFMRKRAGSLAF